MFNRAGRALRGILGGRPARDHPYAEQFAPDMDLPPFEGAPRLYLIASTPRCGSNFLGHALAQSGHFGVPLEYLSARNLEGWRARFGPEPLEAILRRLVAHRTSASGWFGVKAHWSQFEPYADRTVFAPHGGIGRAIFLYRRDLLAQAISYMRAAQTAQFISGAPKQGDARFDYTRLLARADNIRGQNAAWSTYFRDRFEGPVQRVVYEDLVTDQTAGFATIRDFLDPDCPVAPSPSERTQRQSDAASDAWRRAATQALQDHHRWLIEPQVW